MFHCFSIIICLAVNCPPVPMYNNAIPNTHITIAETEVTFTCDIGLFFPDRTLQKTIACNIDGTWNRNLTHCKGLSSVNYVLSEGGIFRRAPFNIY